VADERTRYFRQLRRLRRSARRWSVLAATTSGATAVLVPYEGLGLPDAGWAAAAGGSTALAMWRWSDRRALAAQSAPRALDPAAAADRTRARLVAAVQRLPAGHSIVREVRRQRDRVAFRGSAAAEPSQRLDRASQTLAVMVDRLAGLGEPAVLEASEAERSLRDLAQRVASVEQTLRFAPADARLQLAEAHRGLVEQLAGGVSAYERLVAAAASYVAEDSRSTQEDSAAARLAEAGDLLRGVAAGLAEMRTSGDRLRPTP